MEWGIRTTRGLSKKRLRSACRTATQSLDTRVKVYAERKRKATESTKTPAREGLPLPKKDDLPIIIVSHAQPSLSLVKWGR